VSAAPQIKMTLRKLIAALCKQREKLDDLIAAVEQQQSKALAATPKLPKRRGRKSMGPEERHVVSERMKKYWAGRERGSGQSK
jgi:hypothetical protein